MGGRGVFFEQFPVILAKIDPKIDLFGLILTILPSEAKPLFGGAPPDPPYIRRPTDEG